MPKVTTLTDYELDPRPDLESDHGYWVALLRLAKMKDIDIFGILHCLRCGGAGLQNDPVTGLRIVPGEWEQDRYNQFKITHLRPNLEPIKDLLIRASKVNPITQQQLFATSKKEGCRCP